MRELLPLDIKKLKEEDRRFLLNKSLTEAIASHQGSMHNTMLVMTFLAILISTFSVVYTTRILWIIIVFVIFAFIGLIIFVIKFKKTQNNLALERQKIKIDYDELFKYHFQYATKKEVNKNA